MAIGDFNCILESLDTLCEMVENGEIQDSMSIYVKGKYSESYQENVTQAILNVDSQDEAIEVIKKLYDKAKAMSEEVGEDEILIVDVYKET